MRWGFQQYFDFCEEAFLEEFQSHWQSSGHNDRSFFDDMLGGHLFIVLMTLGSVWLMMLGVNPFLL